jgi:hypothetical protein
MTPELKPLIGLLAIRVSSDKQGLDGDSPEAQREQGIAYALNHNIVITETVILMESASHDAQPMQQVIDRCKDKTKGIQIVLIKSIDRFTRGGGDYYSPLKKQLTEMGISLTDMYGIIGQRQINTLEHTGFKYYWSEFNPTQKAEFLEAERAKDEMRDIMSRMIGAEIRYTQLGYWMRQQPYGYKSEKVDTRNGKRLILVPNEEEASYVRRLFEMRAAETFSNQQIADELNALGFKTRVSYVRNKYDKTKIIRKIGGNLFTAKMVDYYAHKLIFAGIIKEKWTYDQPVKAQFDGLVSIELFNKANHGKLFIEVDSQNNVTVGRKQPPQHLAHKNVRNPDYPYKKVVACPICSSPLLGSASKGKMGKYYPAYHCSNHGHYFRVPKAEFEQTIKEVVTNLQIAPDQIDAVLKAVETKWLEKQAQMMKDSHALTNKRLELETQIAAVIDRMKMVTSETVVKRLEAEVIDLEKQMLQTEQNQPKFSDNNVDMEVILKYIKYLMEHLSDILLHLRNPLRKAAFFGAIFDTMPKYDNLVDGTRDVSKITEVNQLFQIALEKNPSMVTSRRIELRLPG